MVRIPLAAHGTLAQSVEQGSEKPCVTGSIPVGAIYHEMCYALGMALFSREEAEDHGHGLLAEFEDVVSELRDRVARRTDVVRSRLSALESEHDVLSDLNRRLDSHQPQPQQ